jgi:flagellar secretion chaperone FliS
MSYGLAQARYASDAAATVSPGRLVVMLYDRLVTDLAAAEEAMRQDDHQTLGERLGRAQEILLELHHTLDVEAWDAGKPLAGLYLWLVSELMHARVEHSADRVAQCRRLLEPLRDAWREIADAGVPESTARLPLTPVPDGGGSTTPDAGSAWAMAAATGS